MRKSALTLPLALLVLASLAIYADRGQTQERDGAFTPEIPRTWDDAAMATLNLPLANPLASPKQVAADYYYRIPVRKIYKSYPIYHPDKMPPGYLESLRQLEPQEVWDASKLKTQADWERAGEIVFDAPIEFDDAPFAHIPAASLFATLMTNRLFYEQTGIPITRDGVMPYARYVIRTKGRIEVGGLSCAMCHTRLMADGSVIKGAQGNFPFDRLLASGVRDAEIPPSAFAPPAGQQVVPMLFDAPWVQPAPMAQFGQAVGVAGPAAVAEAIPPGVLARHGTSPLSPVQVPDLIGVRERRYLDSTGLQRHHGLADLMRYAALNQDADLLAQYDGFRPIELLIPGGKLPEDPATPAARLSRYSDEQLYALVLYVYSLDPPPNPNLPATAERKTLVERGAAVFEEQDCARCHTPPHYTNNRLVAAPGFEVPADHPEQERILDETVDTDPTLTLTTRRGTGFYKVPSLRGVWYRGPFEHNGSVATLEDWFDPRRLEDDYVPTGWKGPPGTETRAVEGHEFGLDLPDEDKVALIAFLKTL